MNNWLRMGCKAIAMINWKNNRAREVRKVKNETKQTVLN